MALLPAIRAPEMGEWTPETGALLRHVAQRAVSPAERRALAEAEYTVAMNRGQPARGARAYGPAVAGEFPVTALDAVFWDGDEGAARPRLAALASVAATPPPRDPGPARVRWAEATFLVAQAALARGDTTPAQATARRLHALPPVDTVPLMTEMPRRYVLLLDAQLSVFGGASDAASRLESLDSLLRLGPFGVTIRAVGNLVAARLWEQRGDLPRAYAALRRTGRGPTLTPFFSTYLRERARLAAALGDREAAIRDYRRYLSARGERRAGGRRAGAQRPAERRRPRPRHGRDGGDRASMLGGYAAGSLRYARCRADSVSGRFRSTRVYARRGGRWRLVSAHESRIAPPSPAK
jgi:hypothetical protein